MNLNAECIFDGGAILGEGPVWDERTGSLDWIDIERGKICRFNPVTGVNQEWVIAEQVGFAVNTDEGNVLAGTRRGLIRFSRTTGKTTPWIDPEAELPDNRFNDGKCDLQGRLWAGTMCLDESKIEGSLYRIDPDGTVDRQLNPVQISNGLAWSADSQRMYYIDSPTRRIDVFDFDPEHGRITNRRTLAVIEESGFPDGMTIDAEGHLWVALWEGWGVVCLNSKTGEQLAKIDVPVSRVTSCCFGGSNLTDLYITTASRDLTEADRQKQPNAGGLFVARPGIEGTASIRFRKG